MGRRGCLRKIVRLDGRIGIRKAGNRRDRRGVLSVLEWGCVHA